jgi:hypothetical protein
MKKDLEKIYGSKMKLYYQLKDLEIVTGLCYRTLKKRMKKLINSKYKDVPSAICKAGRSYKIHYTVVADFMPINKRKNRKFTPELIEKKLEYTIILNPKEKYYDSAIFHEFVDHLQKDNPSIEIRYSVEDSYDNRGNNMHLNILTDCPFLVKTHSFALQTELFFEKANIYSFQAKNPFSFHKYMQKAVVNY